MVVVVGRLNTKAGQGAEKFGKALRGKQLDQQYQNPTTVWGR